MDTVGAFEAKTHLPKLLDRVASGESITITRHGRPVARLVPIEQDQRERARQAAQRILARREEARKQSKSATIEELIKTTHEGHRY